MGSKTVVYQPPKIEKDDSFEKYLQYQKDRELALDERAQQEREDEARKELQRRKSGAKGLTDYYERTKSQLESGLISYQGAQDQLQSYIDKYDLTAGFGTGKKKKGKGKGKGKGKKAFNPYTDKTKGANQYLTI